MHKVSNFSANLLQDRYTPSPMPSRRALLSVSDKTGITDFAAALVALDYEILSTGGTQRVLQEANIPVTGVEDVTQFPECFSGRVKTMHPLIMGGVLYRRGDTEHEAQAEELGIAPIDLVVVNLYPFEHTAADPQANLADKIEQIDIGGPTLLRSAAKNHAHVTVVTDVADYDRVLEELRANSQTSDTLRAELATKVFARTAAYDAAIAETLSEKQQAGVLLTNQTALRYGENPHQWGAYYDVAGQPRPWKVVQEEKQMSYLNLLDADGAWDLVQEFSEPTAVFVKHANPSGVASAQRIEDAFQTAYDADRLSAFGVIIALNTTCTGAILEKIIDQKIFAEILIAPEYDEEALALMKKRPKLRVVQISGENFEFRISNFEFHSSDQLQKPLLYRSTLGGMLVQEKDTKLITADDLTCATDAQPTSEQLNDLLFAWKVVKHAKSNAIVFAKDQATVGIGCGQTSRVDSTIIAARRAGEHAQHAVMASDAFFPFPDSVEEAAKNGIAAIIQPGGSIRDEAVIAKANELGLVMMMTGVRGFKH